MNEDSIITPPTNAPAKKRSAIVSLFAWSIALAASLLALFSHVASVTWPGAMLANFAAPFALFLVCIVVPIAWRQRIVPSLLILVAALTVSAHLMSAQRAPSGDGDGLRVLVFNAFAESSGNDKTVEMLRETDADLVLINECDMPLVEAILAEPALMARFPHHDFPEHRGQWSRGVLSLWPLERVDRRDGWRGELKFEYLYRRVLIVEHPETPFVTSVTLFESPRSAERWRTGNETMRRDAALTNEYLLAEGLPVLLGADLNATPTAPRSKEFLETTGLRRCKPFMVPAGTWPASFPPALRVPIDDLLVSPGVRVVSWQTIESPTDSDHAPILVTVTLPQAGATSQAP